MDAGQTSQHRSDTNKRTHKLQSDWSGLCWNFYRTRLEYQWSPISVSMLRHFSTSNMLQTTRKPHPIHRMVPLSMTLSDLWPGFQGHDIFEVEYRKKRRVLKTNYCCRRGKWNDTMFGDLDWPLNASHGFVSISLGSCLLITWPKQGPTRIRN